MKTKSSKRSSTAKKSHRSAKQNPRRKSPPSPEFPEATRSFQRKSNTPSTLGPQAPFPQTPGEPSNNPVDAGDLAQVPESDYSGGESVIEMIDEGQDFEAEIVMAVEDSRDPDEGEVVAHRSPSPRAPAYKKRNRL
jgi:hypothetical protein